MRWVTEMMAGRTDRSQYAPGFVGEVTDAAVARMSQDLTRYGAAPLRAEIVQSKKDGDQTFYVLKFVFPRGDDDQPAVRVRSAGQGHRDCGRRHGGRLRAPRKQTKGAFDARVRGVVHRLHVLPHPRTRHAPHRLDAGFARRARAGDRVRGQVVELRSPRQRSAMSASRRFAPFNCLGRMLRIGSSRCVRNLFQRTVAPGAWHRRKNGPGIPICSGYLR